jgi:hypothetical protein
VLVRRATIETETPKQPRSASPRRAVPVDIRRSRSTAVFRGLAACSAVGLLLVLGSGVPQRSSVILGSGLTTGVRSPHAAVGQTTPTVFAFEELLGHHTVLVARLMRAELRDDPNFVQAANDAVVGNTEELAALVASLHGPQAGDQFEELWGQHVGLFFDYASALDDDDERARRAAQTGLDQYRADWGGFIESATSGAIPAATASENLRQHVHHLTAHADAYAAGDHTEAFQLLREGYAHMFPTGRALAGGMTPQPPGELPVPLDNPSTQLRSTLGRLMGEHFAVAVDAMRSGVTGASDFEGVAGALNANTQAMSEAVDSLYGPERAAAFNQAWATHIDALVDYTVAQAEDDRAGAQAAVADMERIRQVLATTFSGLTGGIVTVEAAASVLTDHDRHLMDQLDAFAATDYPEAHRLANEGYHHMFEAAAALAAGIETTMAAAMPAGAPQTGGGGTAATTPERGCVLR